MKRKAKLDPETYRLSPGNLMDMFFLVTSISDNWQWRDFGGSPKDGVGPSQQDTINEAVENIQCSGG